MVRKCAHCLEYAVLAILVMHGMAGNADPSTSSTASRSAGMTSGKGTAIAVILLCAMVATIDEVHQHFVPSRTGSPYDVLLDTTGSTVAMLVLTRRKSARRAEQKTA